MLCVSSLTNGGRASCAGLYGYITILFLNFDGIQTLFDTMNVGLNLLGVHGRNGLGETVNGVEAQANGLSVGAMKGPGVIPAHVYNVNAADFIAVGIDVIELFSGENA